MPGQVIIFRNGQFDIFLGGSCHLVTVLGFKTFLNLDLFFLISIKGLFPVLFYFWSVFLSLVASGLSCSNSVAVVNELSCPWDLPGSGVKFMSPASEGGFLTTGPPEKSRELRLFYLPAPTGCSLPLVVPCYTYVSCRPYDSLSEISKWYSCLLSSRSLALYSALRLLWWTCWCSSCPHVTFSIVGKQVYYTSRDRWTETEYPRSPFQSGLVEELAFWSWPHLQWHRSQLHVWPWVISMRFSQWLPCRAIGRWTRDRGLNKNAPRHLGADAREMVTSFSYSFPSHCVTCLKQLLDL